MSVASIPFTLTVAGQDAAFNLGAIALNVTHVQLGSGNRTPNGNEVALVTPQEYSVISGHFEVSVGQHRIAAVVAGSASAYSVSEIGLWSGVPGGVGSVLVFYWSLASSYIAVKSASVDFNFETDIFFGGVVPGNITIVADTQFNALAMLAAHEAAPDPHTAYLRKDDIVSQVEAEAGAATTPRAWTALRVKQAIRANAIVPGTISKFAQAALPTGWLSTIPSNVSRTTYAALFSAIGTRYGDGDGSTTFGLPGAYSIYENFMNSTDLPVALVDHTATLLPDGRIMIIGGSTVVGTSVADVYFGTITGNGVAWVTSANPLPAPRHEHTTSLLSDGRVLVIGGQNGGAGTSSCYFGTITGNAVSWATSGNPLGGALYRHTANMLPDGRVLVIGGYDGTNVKAACYLGVIAGTAITWSTSGNPLPAARYGHTSVLLPAPDGRILVMGGSSTFTPSETPQAETWFATIASMSNTIAWVSSTSLPAVRQKQTADILPDGRILLISGNDAVNIDSVCYYCSVHVNNRISYQKGTDFHSGRSDHASSLLPDGRIFVTGGIDVNNVILSSTYIGTITLNGIKT